MTPAATLFLCSKEARWITGILMPVDAGVSQFHTQGRECMLTDFRYQLGVPIGRRWRRTRWLSGSLMEIFRSQSFDGE